MEKITHNNGDCLESEISAFIDGELSADEERRLHEHLDVCSRCSASLNDQKLFVQAIQSSVFVTGEIPLPTDFTRKVVATAESRVNGLRRPNEMRYAALLCLLLLMLIAIGLGGDLAGVLSTSANVAAQIAAVLAMASHFVFDIALGSVVVVRNLTGQLDLGSILTLGLFLTAFVFVMLGVSQFLIRNART